MSKTQAWILGIIVFIVGAALTVIGGLESQESLIGIGTASMGVVTGWLSTNRPK